MSKNLGLNIYITIVSKQTKKTADADITEKRHLKTKYLIHESPGGKTKSVEFLLSINILFKVLNSKHLVLLIKLHLDSFTSHN